MRNGQKRMRGRGNHRKSQNPMTRVYESNGPDVKIRGTASHIAEKYIQLARDAQSSGDPVAAENYYQHAEHYFRLIAAAQEQFRQQNPAYYNQQQQQQGMHGAADDFDDGDEDQPYQNEPSYTPAPRGDQPQPFLPRDAQPFPPREQPVVQAPRQQPPAEGQDVGALPAFITGGQPQPGVQQNGHDQQERGNNGGAHRRRRRHRNGFRERGEGAPNAVQAEGEQPSE
ncbi:MAG TPA: DUF4167 domain-containing protein [Pseudolabrys sp.]|nr:DUF4167 domain-containing protein [Pseudolabrys sp.]